MVRLFGQEWTREELRRRIGHVGQVAGIQAFIAADGPARGTRIFQVRTGAGLVYDVIADRALDIGLATFRGIPLAWISPVGFVHPAFCELHEFGWLRYFSGGLLTTCGLDQFGSPCTDEGERLGLHGRITGIPGDKLSYGEYWVSENCELRIQGEVRQARVFGENLRLLREIRSHIGENWIEITDIVMNEGFTMWPHMILYHFNFGFPLISEDSVLQLASREVTPRDEHAAAGLALWQRFSPPTAGFREEVYRHRVETDEEGWATIRILNPTLSVGVALKFNVAQLPFVFQWKMMGEGMYVLGLEPANCGVIEGRARARELGDLPHLQPGESRLYKLRVEAFEYDMDG